MERQTISKQTKLDCRRNVFALSLTITRRERDSKEVETFF